VSRIVSVNRRAGSQSEASEAALDAIIRSLRCERASALLLDEAGIMRFAASRGLSDTYRRAVEGRFRWTRDAKDPQPLCIEDIETAELSRPLKNTVRAEGIGALAFMPLVANGELIGKFITYCRAPHGFSAGEVDLAVTLPASSASAWGRKRTDEGLRETQRQLVS
jgi:GAF domain-containing protein